MATTCPKCRGVGETIKDPCGKCQGHGRVTTDRKISVRIPAGVETGTQLRLSGEGEAGQFGGPNGDLYVEIHVKDDERFERQDQTLHGELSISYLQALLGAEKTVPTLTGESEVEIPQGSADGYEIKLKGEGLPGLRSTHRGDLIYHLNIEIPKKLSKREEELLREIAEDQKVQVLGAKGLFGRKK